MYFTDNALILPLNIHALRAPDVKRPDYLMTALSVPLERSVASRVMTGGDECGLPADATARSFATAVLAEIF
jgi:hypothetical protein